MSPFGLKKHHLKKEQIDYFTGVVLFPESIVYSYSVASYKKVKTIHFEEKPKIYEGFYNKSLCSVVKIDDRVLVFDLSHLKSQEILIKDITEELKKGDYVLHFEKFYGVNEMTVYASILSE